MSLNISCHVADPAAGLMCAVSVLFCVNQSALTHECVFTMSAENPAVAQKEPAVCKHNVHQSDQT